jgi:polyisoprenoid-binding protein YceI
VTSTRPPARRFVLTVLALAVLAAAALPAWAGEQVLVLDPAASEVTFEVQATGHDVHGRLYLDGGEVRFDPATGFASGRIEIDARRGETGNGSRDKTMREKVLEVASYPLFVFEAKRFEGELPAAGRGEVSLIGTLAIHGAQHPLTLPATVERQGDHLRATATFRVPYVEWGMHNPSIVFLRVADEVAVTVATEGDLEPAAGRAAAAAVGGAGGEGRR